MSMTLDKVNQILAEKNAKILPENLKRGVSFFDVEGTLGDLKHFSTIEEMNNSIGNIEEDLAIIHRKETQYRRAEIGDTLEPAYIINRITFPEQITENVTYTMITNFKDQWFGSLTEGTFTINVTSTTANVSLVLPNIEGSVMDISYTSTDGITYANEETSEITNINADLSIYGSNTFGTVKSIDGYANYFFATDVKEIDVFEGIYEFTEGEWKLTETQLTLSDPSQLSKGIIAYGNNGVIEGSAETVKQFSSIEEMNASTGNNKDDIAIANTNVTTGIELDTPYNALTFPKTIILPSVLRSSLLGYGHDDGWTYDISIQVSASTTQDNGFSAKVECNNWSTVTNTTITYDSVDGITFIANEISEDTTMTFDVPIIFIASENSSWSEILSYFAISESSNSQDIYQYNGASWTKLGKDVNDWTSELRSCNGMFEGNVAITEAPYLDTSNVKTMYNMFNGCSSLTTVPLYNTSKVTAMNYAFRNCTSLVSVPQFDVSSATEMQNTFYGCTVLENVPTLNTSSAKYLNGLFLNCISLKTAPEVNTSSATSIPSLFNNCEILETVPLYDCSNADNIYFIFHGCKNLTNLGGLSNLGKGYTQASNDHLHYTLDLSDCVNLTHDSLMNVINNLYDLNLTYDVANGGTLYTQKLNLGATNIAKLTAEEIVIATNKGWNVV